MLRQSTTTNVYGLAPGVGMHEGRFQTRGFKWIAGCGPRAGPHHELAARIEPPLIEFDPDFVAIAIVLPHEPEDDLPPEAIVLARKAVHRPQKR